MVQRPPLNAVHWKTTGGRSGPEPPEPLEPALLLLLEVLLLLEALVLLLEALVLLLEALVLLLEALLLPLEALLPGPVPPAPPAPPAPVLVLDGPPDVMSSELPQPGTRSAAVTSDVERIKDEANIMGFIAHLHRHRRRPLRPALSSQHPCVPRRRM